MSNLNKISNHYFELIFDKAIKTATSRNPELFVESRRDKLAVKMKKSFLPSGDDEIDFQLMFCTIVRDLHCDLARTAKVRHVTVRSASDKILHYLVAKALEYTVTVDHGHVFVSEGRIEDIPCIYDHETIEGGANAIMFLVAELTSAIKVERKVGGEGLENHRVLAFDRKGNLHKLCYGESYLEAIMRLMVCLKLGEFASVPEELFN